MAPSVKQMAEAEAEAAEAEPDEAEQAEEPDGPKAEPEPEPEPEPEAKHRAAERTPEQIQALFDQIVGDFRAAMTELFGVAEPLAMAETPGIVGIVMPGYFDMRTTDDYKLCAVCNGHGIVLTKSHREGYKVKDCKACAGQGFLERLPVAAPAPTVPQITGPTVFQSPAPAPDNGEWGVPSYMGDPRIGPGGPA